MKLPTNIMAEKAVLGAILSDEGALHKIQHRLQPKHFANDANRAIYTVMRNFVRKGRSVDLVTLCGVDEGTMEAFGGFAYISQLVDGLPDAGGVHHYADLVIDAWNRREIIKTCKTVEHTASVGSLSESIEIMRDGIKVATSNKADDISRLGLLLADTEMEISKMINEKASPTMKTGLNPLDAITGGMEPGELIYLAARPSVGKTSLAAQIAAQAGMAGKPTLFCSLEMPARALGQRYLAMASGVPLTRIRSVHSLSPEDRKAIDAIGPAWKNATLWVDDASNQTPSSIESAAARIEAHIERRVELIILDYLQLMRFDGKNASLNERVGEASAEMKRIAKRLAVPVICLSQLKRPPMNEDENRVPGLSELRDSGSLEQDADQVWFLSRKASLGSRETTLAVAKHRNGPVGRCELIFVPETCTFVSKVTTG